MFPLFVPLGVNVPQWRTAVVSQILFALLALLYIPTLLYPRAMIGMFALHAGSFALQYFTYAFIQDSLPHLLINLYFLWLFGVPLEGKIGPVRMTLLILFASAAGGAMHRIFGHPLASEPLAGSSAAIFGAIGAYLMLYPFSIVRCFFCIVIVVVPVLQRTVKVPALFFVPVCFAGLWFAGLLPFEFLLVRGAGAVSTSAHIGGFVAGMLFAVAFYGFYGFTQDAERDRQAERTLQRELADQLRKGRSEKKPEAQAAALLEPAALADVPEPLHPLHRLVVQRMGLQARNVYSELLKIEPQSCLKPELQIELSRMMVDLEADDLAIRALENLVNLYPADPETMTGRLELACLLVKHDRDPDRAGFLLRAVRASGPSAVIARLVEEQLEKVKASKAPPSPSLFQNFDVESFESELKRPEFPDDPPDAPLIEPEVEGELLPAQARAQQLFGNPDDTDNFLPAIAGAPGIGAAARGGAGAGAIKDPTESDSGYEINLDDSEFLREKGIAASPADSVSPFTLMPSNNPHIIDPEPPRSREQDLRWRGEREPRGPHWEEDRDLEIPGVSDKAMVFVRSDAPIITNSPVVFARADVYVPLAPQSFRAPSPIAPDETSPAVYVNSLVTSESNRERALRLRGETSSDVTSRRESAPLYSLIVAPGAAVDIAMVMAVLAPVIGQSSGLSMDGVHHAILRRRGILMHSMELTAARELAGSLARQGQATALVPDSPELEFGDALDLSSLTEEGETVRIGHEKGLETRRWEDAICYGGGWVGPEPGSPCRAALDLFFRATEDGSAPRLRVRLWENTFVFPGVQAGNRHERFLYFVRMIARKTDRAIQTRTLNPWLEGDDAPEVARFSSPIEYDNFLRWHLLAYCVPSQQFLPHT